MNKSKFIFSYLIILSSCIIVPAYGNEEGNDDADKNESNMNKNPDGRPRIPAKKNMTISLADGMLSISFREPEGMATVEIKNLATGISLMYAFDSALGFRCALAQYPASYKVTVKTSKAVYEETL